MERFDYMKDPVVWDDVQRNLNMVMEMIVEVMRPYQPFKFYHMELALIFVAWLIKSKKVIYRDLPNLSGEILVKTWLEMTAWLAIIYAKGGTHFEPIKVSAREARLNSEIAKMKDHLGVFDH
ncbi:hypothetical protein FVER14953_21486 [Fusarium verticillioides]|nr:hypothetical protein FVER14953_21486 [Fusarium verticillioides]